MKMLKQIFAYDFNALNSLDRNNLRQLQTTKTSVSSSNKHHPSTTFAANLCIQFNHQLTTGQYNNINSKMLYLFGLMKGSKSRIHKNNSEYRNVATIVHCRLIFYTVNKSIQQLINFYYGSGPAKSRNPRNPPKFTKSTVHIKQIPRSATKSTYMKRKLSKSNASSHEIDGFYEIQYCLRNPRIRMHSIESIRLGC